jgi:adenylate kinase
VRANQKYFSDHYPDSLFSLTGSTSDEVHQSPSSHGHQAQQHASSSSSTSPSTKQTLSPRIQTPNMTYVPNLELDNNDNAKTAVDQLWPKLQALIEPFGLHRDKELGDKDKNIEHVRQDADDLRDPEEDVHKAQEAKAKR